MVSVSAETSPVLEAMTDALGQFGFASVPPGRYRVLIRHKGFFDVDRAVETGLSTVLEIEMTRAATLNQSVSVEESAAPVAIKNEKPGVREVLQHDQIHSLPIPNARNFLKALPLLPSVSEDREGKLHIRGASSDTINYQIDGVNVTDPVYGSLQNTLSPDAIENIEVLASGYAPEFGRASGGVIRVETRTIPDRFRASVTDFVPEYSFRHKAIGGFTPRFFVQSPIVRGRAWAMYAVSGEFRHFFDEDLPRGGNAEKRLSGDHLLKLRFAATETHLLSSTILFNHQRLRNAGLNRQSPTETTTDFKGYDYSFIVKDRLFLNATALLESALQLSGLDHESRAKGSETYRVWPDRRRGNFNRDEGRTNRRWQWNENLSWSMTSGRFLHQVKAGLELGRIVYTPQVQLRPTELYRHSGTLLRRSRYVGGRFESRGNTEFGFFIQDTVNLRRDLIATYGFREDWDQTTLERSFAPRAGLTWYPGESRRTRINGGFGHFFDKLPLFLLIQDQWPQRIESVFSEDGLRQTATFVVSRIPPRHLRIPMSRNWDLGIERELRPNWVVRADYLQRSGRRELRQLDTAPPRLRDKEVWLEVTNTGRSDYRSFHLSTDVAWKQDWRAFAGYLHSRSRESLRFEDFALNIRDQDLEVAPANWDAPHRLVSWALFPFFKESRAGVTVEARSGFPFSVRDADQKIVGHRNERRFPLYFNLGLSFEREFPFVRNYRILIRLSGFNLTDHFNPRFVDSSFNSPGFLLFSNAPGRSGNIRLQFRKR